MINEALIPQPKILLVDDEQKVLDGLSRILWKFKPIVASSPKVALEILKEEKDIAVIVSDYHMPIMDGLSLLNEVNKLSPDSRTIMLTGESDSKIALKAVNNIHVFKYLKKPCSATDIRSAITEAIDDYETKTLNTKREISTLHQEIIAQKYIDPLTKLLSRRGFVESLDKMLQDSNPQKSHMMMLLDLDFFHLTNDLLGQKAGDFLLQQISTLILSKVRSIDLAARLSADQYGVVFLSCPNATAYRYAAELQKKIDEDGFFWKGESHKISCSIGLIEINPLNTSAVELIQLAELAKNKARSKTKLKIYITSVEDPKLQNQLEQAESIRQIQVALALNKFQLYYQTIEPSHEAPGIHFEVLLRLVNEDGLIISSEKFLPIANQFRLSGEIDQWVILNVAEWLKRAGPAADKIALCLVSISGTSLQNTELISFIDKCFAKHKNLLKKLCFEITETPAITKIDTASTVIQALKFRGCKIAIDDIGAGHASFSYLKNFDAEYVKIDGAFIGNILHDPVDEAITKAIVEICRTLNKKTIAELVENDQIAERLRQLGVDYFQGYGIAKPRPMNELSL